MKDPANPAAWEQEIDENTRLVWIETPSNPTLFITDIAAIADVAHAREDNAIAKASPFP